MNKRDKLLKKVTNLGKNWQKDTTSEKNHKNIDLSHKESQTSVKKS